MIKIRGNRTFSVIFLVIFFSVFTNLILAQDFNFIGDVASDEFPLYQGETKSIPVNRPTRVVVGNPKIADILNVSDKSIIFSGKSVGSTVFAYWDILGEHSFKIRVLTEDMADTKMRIDKLLSELKLSGVSTKSNDNEGKVLLLGEVKSKQEKDLIDLVLGPLKDKTLDLIKIKEQGIVEIDVQVLELDKDATKTLGFTWPGALEGTNAATIVGASSAKEFFRIADWTRSQFAVKLDMLIQEGKVRVLSHPKLACLSGKEAELLVGGEKPIFTSTVQSVVGTSTTVSYKEFGIKLKIRPTIADKDKVHVGLNVEVSEVGSAEVIGLANAPTAKAYPLTKRTVSTELFLKDGQTLAIGGLIKQKSESDIRKVAFLGDVPLLGALFRQKVTKTGGGQGERGDVELFVTLTPTIVADKGIVQPNDIESLPEEMIESSGKEERDVSEVINEYVKSVQEKILDSAYYPVDAQDLGYEGTVKLGLTIKSSGYLESALVSQPSGYEILDEAALDVVNKQAPYPPFPKVITLDKLQIEVPIAYRKD